MLCIQSSLLMQPPAKSNHLQRATTCKERPTTKSNHHQRPFMIFYNKFNPAKSNHLLLVLVSNNNMYIDIKPYFYFCIDRYWNIGFTSFRSFPKRKQIWRFRFSSKWNLTKMIEKPIYFSNFIFYLHGKQLNCVYLVVCSDIDIVPYIINISIFSMDQ